MGGLSDFAPMSFQTPISGIINLRFEECKMASKAVSCLRQFLTQKQLIETFFVHKVDYQDPVADFKLMIEGLQFSMKIRKIGINGMLFDEEAYGKIISHLLIDCRQLREIDLSLCDFFHPKCFFEMFQTLLNEKCRLNVLKLKNLHITVLEGKVLQLVLMKNKSLHTLDISNSVVDSGECLEFFLQKFDKYSNIKYLILDNIQPDLSPTLEILGEALNSNTQLTHLIMRDNKLKWMPFSNFWENMKNNSSLLKLNISKTDLTDRVLEKMCIYLKNPSLKVQDLDIS